MKITIIGAGPAGNFSAYLLARAGHDVSVFEEHKTIGEPVACTGVVTGDLMAERLQIPKKLIVNKIAKARIFAPNGRNIEVGLKNDIIIDRAGFDMHIAGLAKKAGARFFLGHLFEKAERSLNGKVAATIKDKGKGNAIIVESDYLIGADGPASRVAKSSGLYAKRSFYAGIQVTIPLRHDNIIDFYPSRNGIAWVVPENEETARVGIAAKKGANSYFREFLTSMLWQGFGKKIIGWQAGPIPLYNPFARTQSRDGRIILVGDAAAMVKASTLGGINQSLIAAEAAAEAIGTGKDYQKIWKMKMGMDLYLSLIMRKAMERFSTNDYNKLIKIFAKEKNKQILEKFDRDEPSRFALRLLMNEPSLLLLARKAIF